MKSGQTCKIKQRSRDITSSLCRSCSISNSLIWFLITICQFIVYASFVFFSFLLKVFMWSIYVIYSNQLWLNNIDRNCGNKLRFVERRSCAACCVRLTLLYHLKLVHVCWQPPWWQLLFITLARMLSCCSYSGCYLGVGSVFGTKTSVQPVKMGIFNTKQSFDTLRGECLSFSPTLKLTFMP